MDPVVGSSGEVVRYIKSIYHPPKPSLRDYCALFGVVMGSEGWQNLMFAHLTGNPPRDHNVSDEFMQLDDGDIERLGVLIPSLIEQVLEG